MKVKFELLEGDENETKKKVFCFLKCVSVLCNKDTSKLCIKS